ncbi:hypothetical protein [Limosilactobacillus reuteri]|uniref:hypothetical protein n=1 Tax=Limosilactobacillus reuteri TaxID=1598 RepID=UPI001E2C307D|nr:hypothetical protein [Limosilactobacillus reuteri]
MKRIYFRIFVYAPTLAELDKRVHDVIRQNGMFHMARYADEQLDDLNPSLFLQCLKKRWGINQLDSY